MNEKRGYTDDIKTAQDEEYAQTKLNLSQNATSRLSFSIELKLKKKIFSILAEMNFFKIESKPKKAGLRI